MSILKGLDRSKLRVLWYFLRPNKGGVVGLFVLSLLIGAADSFNIVVLYHIFNYGLDVSVSESNIFFRIFERINDIIPITDQFASAALFFIGLALIVALLRVFEALLRARVISTVLERNRNRLFARYLDADYEFFVQHKQGDLIYNAHEAPESLSRTLIAISTMLSDILLAVQIFILLFALSWWGTLAVLGLGAVYYIMTRWIGKRKAYRFGRDRATAKQGEQSLLGEFIGGIRTIKIYLRESYWAKKYRALIAKDYTALRKHTIWSSVPRIFLDLVMYATIGGMAIVLKYLFPYDFKSVLPVFGAFGYAVFRLLPRFTSFGNLLLTIINQLPNLELVYDTLHAPLKTIEDGTRELEQFRSEVHFDGVTFAYTDRESVLEGLTLRFKKGEMSALVGASGSGKSTIINLLVRLFDPDHGAVAIDGIDLKELERASWLEKIGFVGQEPYLFNATLCENITFGESYPEEEVIAAAKKAHAHPFIEALPDGYDTRIGDRGMRLSGGQMQRIAIARAILRDPQVVILDEATSSLDSLSERLIQDAIADLARDCTVIVIAHRLSTIIAADRIYVIADGKVAESGTHEELLDKGGNYLELYLAQQGTEQEQKREQRNGPMER